jgi:hypothetical protein
MIFMVYKVAPRRIFPRFIRFSLAVIFPAMLCAHLYVLLFRRTSGRIPEKSNKPVLFRKSWTLQKKMQLFNLSASRELCRTSGFANPAILFVRLI